MGNVCCPPNDATVIEIADRKDTRNYRTFTNQISSLPSISRSPKWTSEKKIEDSVTEAKE